MIRADFEKGASKKKKELFRYQVRRNTYLFDVLARLYWWHWAAVTFSNVTCSHARFAECSTHNLLPINQGFILCSQNFTFLFVWLNSVGISLNWELRKWKFQTSSPHNPMQRDEYANNNSGSGTATKSNTHTHNEEKKEADTREYQGAPTRA